MLPFLFLLLFFFFIESLRYAQNKNMCLCVYILFSASLIHIIGATDSLFN